jgi:pyruvate ferredoxin oxidoreductase gamma subunit
VAFCRIDERPIRVREPIVAPDALIIQDPTLLHQVDVFNGLRPGGLVLLSSTRTPAELGLGELEVICVPAAELAREHLGKPLPNAALLGAFAAVSGVVTLESVAAAIRERFATAPAEANVKAAEAAFALIREPSHA